LRRNRPTGVLKELCGNSGGTLKIAELIPRGAVDRIYGHFADAATHLGTLENIAEDCVSFLREAGEDISEDIWLSEVPRNTGEGAHKNYDERAKEVLYNKNPKALELYLEAKSCSL
jgi:hypothetical protein